MKRIFFLILIISLLITSWSSVLATPCWDPECGGFLDTRCELNGQTEDCWYCKTQLDEDGTIYYADRVEYCVFCSLEQTISGSNHGEYCTNCTVVACTY